MIKAIKKLFLGEAPSWYKSTILFFLIINPLALFTLNALGMNGNFIVGWIFLLEFIFTLALALKCYPLQPGGLLAIQAIALGLTSTNTVYYEIEHNLEVILLLETSTSESPAITYQQYQQLYKEVGLDYKGQKEINKKIKEDEFFNALQIKFAYAITCHKSQGGQWENVFIDLGYFTEDMLDKSYLRWLYTALTRASKKLYLINFKNEFF